MTTNGPKSFDQPIRTKSSILADTPMKGDFVSARRAVGQFAHVFQKASGAASVQLVMTTTGRGLNSPRYAWTFDQVVWRESEVRLLDRLSASKEPVFLVDYSVITESFRLEAGANSFSLARYEAANVVGSFEGSPTYPHKAWIEGTEKTVVTGTPADSSEVRVNGIAVETAGSTAGDLLEVRYYPAYQVIVFAGNPTQFQDHQDQVRSVELWEVGT